MTGALAPALQTFLTGSYGAEVWGDILRDSKIGIESFEPMLSYDAATSRSLLSAAARRLERTEAEVLEDLGIYFVASDATEPIRRLLRFGGADFHGFLDTLADLPDRARLALPHVVLPELIVEEEDQGKWIVWCDAEPEGMVHLTLGMIRAMADDYGALVVAMLDEERTGRFHRIDLLISSHHHAEGRAFEIGKRVSR